MAPAPIIQRYTLLSIIALSAHHIPHTLALATSPIIVTSIPCKVGLRGTSIGRDSATYEILKRRRRHMRSLSLRSSVVNEGRGGVLQQEDDDEDDGISVSEASQKQTSKANVNTGNSKPPKTVRLDTQDLKSSLRFQRATWMGKNVIVIDAVRIGSSAELKGLKPGQILLSISDPMRGEDQMYNIEDKTSLRFLLDCIRVSMSKTTTLIVQDPDPTQPAPKLNRKGVDAASALRMQTTPETDASGRVDNVQRRIRERKEALEFIGQRNDVPFLVQLAAILILPGLFGLIIAYASGYQFYK